MSAKKRKTFARAPVHFSERRDPTFFWAEKHAPLKSWRGAMVDWLAQLTSRTVAVEAGNLLLDYALATSGHVPTPEVFCRRSGRAPNFTEWAKGTRRPTAGVLNKVRQFFEWYLDTHLSAPDDRGRCVRSPEHFNPIAVAKGKSHRHVTHRDAMPTRYLRELRSILMDNDWEWARGFRRDYVDQVDRISGERTKVWCPVRATALALKLMLPLRTFQVRMLDSGEGDNFVLGEQGWEKNSGAHAPTDGLRVSQGFLRRIEDRLTKEPMTGLYVNTNKTSASCSERGYEIPWTHKEVIGVVRQLVAWQSKHNEVDAALPWSLVDDAEVQLSGTDKSGAAFFLMRYPCAAKRTANQPITTSPIKNLWTSLCHELEMRLAARGDRTLSGEPIRLTWLNDRGARRAVFDLHSLRVSLLTSLAIDGDVPIHVLSKVVAGHASVVMTLYYVKVGPLEVSRQLEEASEKVDRAEQWRFAQYLASERRQESCFVSNDPAGVAAMNRNDSAQWSITQTGLCPAGARCHEGGPQLSPGKHGPVPGGPYNCARCRFHLTGPPFLKQMVAVFNTKSMQLQNARSHYQEMSKALDDARIRRYAAELDATAGTVVDVEQALTRFEAAESVLSESIATLQALYRLVERSRSALQISGPNALVLAGGASDLEVAVRQASEVELWDTVCRNASIHPCVEVDEATARRSRAIAQMLVKHGHPPVILSLPPEVERTACTEFVRWMKDYFGQDVAVALLDGREDDLPDVHELVAVAADQLKLAAAAATTARLGEAATTAASASRPLALSSPGGVP